MECFIGRKPPKLTQEAVAAAIGVSQPTVQRWLKGSHLPDAEDLAKLADLFKISADDLLGRAALKYPDLNNSGGLTVHDVAGKKDIARLNKIADTLAEQLGELRRAIHELEK